MDPEKVSPNKKRCFSQNDTLTRWAKLKTCHAKNPSETCLIEIHTVKGFGIVNKAEIDVLLELSCFFHDPAHVGNLISGSSAFLCC